MKTIKNFFYLLIGDGVSYVLLFIATIYLARILGVEGFGRLSYAFAFFSFGSFLTNLGLVSIGTRDIAQKKSIAQRQSVYVRNVIALRQILALSAFVLLLITVLVIHKPISIKWLIVLYGLSFFPFAFILEWLFLGWEKMPYVTLQKIINSGFYLCLLLILVKSQKQILIVPIVFWVGNFCGGLLLWLIYRLKTKDNSKEIPGGIYHTPSVLLRDALPIGLGAILIQFSQNFSIIFLGSIRTDEMVGIFSAANKLIITILILDRVFGNTVFPKIARDVIGDKHQLSRNLNQLIKLILTAIIPIVIGGLLLSSDLVNLIYGNRYQASAIVFQVLLGFLFLTMLNTISTATLIADKKNRSYVLAIASGVLANIILNIILVPLFNALGTAIALTIGELVTFIILSQKIKPVVHIYFLPKHIIKPLLASSVMACFIKLLSHHISVIPLIVFAILVYSVIMILIKGITKQDFITIQT